MEDNRPPLHLSSASLLSKYGFSDGDMPDHVWDRIDELGIPYADVDWHPVLRKLVHRYLLPELAKHHEVVIEEIETIHNPIRAFRVDGVEIDDVASRQTVTFAVEGVDVPMSVVIEELLAAGHG